MPGRIASGSADAAIGALGGMDAVARAFAHDLVPLELRLRAADPFAHAVLGEVIATSNLLLRVSRKRRKRGSGVGGAHRDPEDYRLVTEIIGIVTRTGRFRALADFQYCVDPSDPLFKLKKSLNTFDVEGISQFEFSTDTGVQPNLRMIPPPCFSKIEWALSYRYQQYTDITSVRVPTNRGGEQIIKLPKKPPKNPMIKFRKDSVKVPTGPTPEILSIIESRFPNTEAILARIQQLFAERPMYTFRALFNHCRDVCKKKSDTKLVPFLMTRYAYFITHGPWQEVWARYGYDPRLDREARMYQIISMRMIKAPTTLKRAKRLIGVSSQARLLGSMNGVDEEDEDDDKSHMFDGTLWKGCARMQICDVTDPDVVRVSSTNRGIRRTADPKDGWYETSYIENIRKIIRNKIMRQTGRNVDESHLPDYIGDEEGDGEGEGEREEEQEVDIDFDDGDGEDDEDDDDESTAPAQNIAVEVSAVVASKIDALMKSLQSSQGVSSSTQASQLVDDDEDDEFNYFEGDDD
ncbi:RNA polymerase III transcription factor IIIC subunit-domain-containing protein [Obelidium mucronatum]|nr:RNA polymerase III transcription factor IIIC subunit-domain-containing protein [Obelidium mucronatum]